MYSFSHDAVAVALERLFRGSLRPGARSECRRGMADPEECFVAFNVTLQGLNMVEQNATFRCFVNCMFRCQCHRA